MNLTAKEREQIYQEEKIKREEASKHISSSRLVLFLTLGAVAGVAGYLMLHDRVKARRVSLEDLRKAYDGLAPDEENM
jgi:H+/Cl- antiporter ClcA